MCNFAKTYFLFAKNTRSQSRSKDVRSKILEWFPIGRCTMYKFSDIVSMNGIWPGWMIEPMLHKIPPSEGGRRGGDGLLTFNNSASRPGWASLSHSSIDQYWETLYKLFLLLDPFQGRLPFLQQIQQMLCPKQDVVGSNAKWDVSSSESMLNKGSLCSST